ncbi:MAG: YbhB/YbcL family Raf kinase inhibitor-like protein [Ardenticatenia bacterium]|nr:YbhB/YbcL family Raf kinase inhibitor-like protein [Ardenticatenia bacterium]
MRHLFVLAVALISLLSLVACVPTRPRGTSVPETAPSSPQAFTLMSPAFDDGGLIPTRYTCDGEDLSPPLRWAGAPADTRSFALIVTDPDAPRGTFTHWVLFDLPAEISSLPEGLGVGTVGVAGRNDFGRLGYGGPCPPQGDNPHRYIFTLYALRSASLSLPEGASRDQVGAAMSGYVVGEVSYTGRYGRR